ncbi:hypothetical protein ERX46_12075 [Brumimicrobium glaciale]|uniref:Amidase domain-containing protein n=1 Tax=Brumimicrobium glaciale TaxID=200475 RepID=A0A4Q4KKG6_9FLAO|nr:amidase family protein [Brumimicrobium glaciale]RYM32794.1 hypothetical protein ERX46_12075 [Brumimicrobium glaciale]
MTSKHNKNSDLAFLTVTEIAKRIRNKEITSEFITGIYIERIKRFNPQLNAIVIDMEKDALERAKAADVALAQGKSLGKLHGVPITVKEAFNIKGYKTTVNFKQLKNNIALEHSDIVNLLYNEGAIILGKTNIPTLLTDHQTHGPLYPRANNPFDLTRTTGGSTGGGASAVASGLSGVEVGSDMGGSVRIPAHFCGVYSLKTTDGAVSEKGHVPPLPKSKGAFQKMAVFGPISRSLDDLELVFDIIKKEGNESNKDKPKYLAFENKVLSDYSLAWTDSMNDIKAGEETITLLNQLVNDLSGQVKHIEKTLPIINYKEAEENWANILGYLLGQDLPFIIQKIARFQFTYGYSARGKGQHISNGILGNNPKKLEKFTSLRQENIEVFQEFFKNYSFILSPIAVGPAFEHCRTGKPIQVDGREINYWDMCLPFVYIANVLGFPALIAPLGQTKDGLPIGIQIIGPNNSEKELIHFGKLLLPYIQGFKKPENFK